MALWKYVVRRMALAVPTLLALLTLVFFIFYVAPVDPAVAWAGPFATTEVVESLRREYRLNEPVHVQFYYYLVRLSSGDLGRSIQTNNRVIDDLAVYFPYTVELVIFSSIISIAGGIFFGVISALRPDRLIDHMSRVLALFGTASPRFWTAIIAQIVFYAWLGWLPAVGITSIGTKITRVTGMPVLDALLTQNIPGSVDAFLHLILPGVVLALPQISILSRLVRNTMLEVTSQDYVTVAKSKGLPERYITQHYVLRNAMLPTTTQIGLMIGWLLGGAVIVETVFTRPGMGRYAAESALLTLDIPAIMGAALVGGVVFTICNLVVDMTYAYLDPRIRIGGGRA